MYDMLEFSLSFQEALDTITGDKEMKLQKYKMNDDEWQIANQLREVLKVSLFVYSHSYTVTWTFPVRSSRMQHCFSHKVESQT